MLFPHSNVEARVIQMLSTGPQKTTEIVATVARHAHVTPEAVYLAIRNLRKKRVMVTTKGIASLYVFWIQEMQKLVGTIEDSYTSEYTGQLLYRDIKDPSFHSKTFHCADFIAMENHFHHIAQSIIKPQKTKKPYFSFGFAPWWMTLHPNDAESFFKLLIKYNYQPLLVMAKECAIDKANVKHLRSLGCQIAFVGEKLLPQGFEGHWVDGFSIEAQYPPSQYTPFLKAYHEARLSDVPKLIETSYAFKNMKVKIIKRKIPFHRTVLDMFAVPAELFKTE